MGLPSFSEISAQLAQDTIKPTDDVAPESAPAPAESAPEPKEAAPEQAPDVNAQPTPEQIQQALDLKELVKDKKFKFEDQEFTLEDLKKSIMRNKDYTQKTQEISKFKKEYEELKGETKYVDALVNDVKRVEANPELVAQFKDIYPKKFHKYIEHIKDESPLTEDRIAKLIESKINPIVESMTQKETEVIQSTFENWDKELGSKYKEADINQVYSLIEKAKADGTPLSKELWEHSWKASHEYFSKKLEERMAQKYAEKTKLNQAGKDTKPGGAAPANAPEKWGLKDAGKKMAEFLASQQN